jgi:hypothetical protein
MEANNATFLKNSTSEPFLSNHFIEDVQMNNNIGKATIQIDVIPVNSVTEITTFLDVSKVSNSEELLKINIRSNEIVGNRGILVLLVFYIWISSSLGNHGCAFVVRNF